MIADDLLLAVSWFDRAIVRDGRPALGEVETLTWTEFAASLLSHRLGEKDGPCFAAARFKPDPDGRVRRLGRNLIARTALALDIETSKQTGEIPPSIAEAARRIARVGWAGVVYSSHSYTPDAPRYRVVLPISEEIDCALPAVEVVAERLDLAGVIDAGKTGAASLFYLPSCPVDAAHLPRAEATDGDAVDAEWLREAAGAVLVSREAEQAQQADAARAAAEARRQAKIAAGFDPDDSLIERLRVHFDLAGVLLAHGYDQSGTKFRHPNSTSGSYGANVKAFGGIERVFSHNATDPLHASNLPEWCSGVTALDVVDVVTILDYGGDRRKALAELAQRFGLTKREEQKHLAKLIFGLIRKQASQEEIERQSYAEGERLGLTRAEVVRVATWVASQATSREAA